MLESLIEKFLEKITSQANNLLPKPPRRFSVLHQGCGFIISTTTRCNFHCPHCLRSEIDDDKTIVKDLPLPVFETALKGGKKLGFQYVSFSGGEPILHPRFSDLVSLAGKYGYTYNFATNGWFHNEYWKIIEQNCSNLDVIFLSMDGITAEVHDAVRNKAGSFDKLIETANFYRNHNLSMTATFCVTKKNYHQIEGLPEFCLKLGIKTTKWAAAVPIYDKFGAVIKDYALTDEERAGAFKKILDLREKLKSKCNFIVTRSFYPVSGILGEENKNKKDFEPWCPILDCHNLYIDHDGGMFFCCDMNRECKNKPLIQNLGFKESLKITLNSASEIKKKAVENLFNGREINRFCDFCNNNIKDCLSLAMREK